MEFTEVDFDEHEGRCWTCHEPARYKTWANFCSQRCEMLAEEEANRAAHANSSY